MTMTSAIALRDSRARDVRGLRDLRASGRVLGRASGRAHVAAASISTIGFHI